MQTLGLSESTPRTEGRLKSLFWPSITTGNDVDYLGAQGYWVCTIVAVLSFVFLLAMGAGALVAVITLLLYYLGGVGVRERSRLAATIVLVLYLMDTMVAGIGIVRIIVLALLLSNVRATFIAAAFQPQSEDAAPPPRMGATLSDKFADRLPMWLWPKVRYVYYALACGALLFIMFGMMVRSMQ